VVSPELSKLTPYDVPRAKANAPLSEINQCSSRSATPHTSHLFDTTISSNPLHLKPRHHTNPATHQPKSDHPLPNRFFFGPLPSPGFGTYLTLPPFIAFSNSLGNVFLTTTFKPSFIPFNPAFHSAKFFAGTPPSFKLFFMTRRNVTSSKLGSNVTSLFASVSVDPPAMSHSSVLPTGLL
jgi:hypothetical protein